MPKIIYKCYVIKQLMYFNRKTRKIFKKNKQSLFFILTLFRLEYICLISFPIKDKKIKNKKNIILIKLKKSIGK